MPPDELNDAWPRSLRVEPKLTVDGLVFTIDSDLGLGSASMEARIVKRRSEPPVDA